MTSDESTEQAIIAAGASTAPRVTPDDIEANIVATEIVKHVSVSGQVLRWAVLTTCSGYSVSGEPSCAVSNENDSQAVGETVAIENARQALWPLMGYALKERLSNKPVDAIPAKPGKKTVVFLKTEHATGDVVSLKASDVVSVAEINDGVAVVKALAAELGEDGEVVNVVRSIGITNTAAGSDVVILIGAGDIGLPAIPRGGDLYVQGIPPDAHKAVADAK